MKQIFIINQLDIDKGKVVTLKSNSYEAVFLKQGSLDGACGPYCLFMALLIVGAIRKKELDDLWNIDRKKRLGKLIKAMLDHDTLFGEGTSLIDLEKLLSKSFKKVINTEINEFSGKSIIPFVIEQLKQDCPVIVGIKNRDMAHWLLAVGFEKEESVTKLLFLDPSGIDTSNYWNAAIDIVNKQGGRYPYAWIDHNESSNEFIQFEEAMAIINK
jgi:hypothetical protein